MKAAEVVAEAAVVAVAAEAEVVVVEAEVEVGAVAEAVAGTVSTQVAEGWRWCKRW